MIAETRRLGDVLARLSDSLDEKEKEVNRIRQELSDSEDVVAGLTGAQPAQPARASVSFSPSAVGLGADNTAYGTGLPTQNPQSGGETEEQRIAKLLAYGCDTSNPNRRPGAPPDHFPDPPPACGKTTLPAFVEPPSHPAGIASEPPSRLTVKLVSSP